MTTKLHVACVDEHTAVAMTLTEGQRHDSVPVFELVSEAEHSGKLARLTADRAYDGDPTRRPLAQKAIELVIPSPSHRKIKAECPPELYGLRHKVENFFRKLFDFRRVATRYDKLARCFLGFVHLASAVVLLRGFIR